MIFGVKVTEKGISDFLPMLSSGIDNVSISGDAASEALNVFNEVRSLATPINEKGEAMFGAEKVVMVIPSVTRDFSSAKSGVQFGARAVS